MGDPVSSLATVIADISAVVTATVGWIGDYSSQRRDRITH